MNIDYSKITDNPEVVELLKQRIEIENKIKAIDETALIMHEIALLSLTDVSNSVICCPQCGNERLESTGDGWYICCDKDCDWGDKL
jgi:hypothetical protein